MLTLEKIFYIPAFLRRQCEDLKRGGKKIVLTTGIFDILHVAHVRYLEEARGLGDILVVGVNSDAFTRKIKGERRPIINEHERAYLIAAMSMVDYVHIFDCRLTIVDLVKPNVFVMSSTSHVKPETRSEQQERVRSYGGEIVIYGEMTGIHTTGIIDKIINLL